MKKCEKERKGKKKDGGGTKRTRRAVIKTSKPTDTRNTDSSDRIVGGERREAKFAKGDKRQKKKEQPPLPPALCIWREEASLIDPISCHEHTIRAAAMLQRGNF